MATRRDFLKSGLLAAAATGGRGMPPLFVARTAAAAQQSATAGRVLVVLELTGGNDGLNTVVPFRDDAYHRSRPKLRLPENKLHKVNDTLGLHPSLRRMKGVFDDGQLAIVQSVGYPNPNRSHFESMAIWQSARPGGDADLDGWLARALDGAAAGDADPPAIHVGTDRLPQALTGGGFYPPTLPDATGLRLRLGDDAAAAAAERRTIEQMFGSQAAAKDPLLQFVCRSAAAAFSTSARLSEIIDREQASSGFPDSALGQQLQFIARMIRAGLTTQVYYAQHPGFDTHGKQLDRHSLLLSRLDRAVEAFFSDLARHHAADRVLVLVFSEFGRRLVENASRGTDHGTAAPLLLVGPAVQPGIYGPNPNLLDLADGEPQHAIDFRRVYATLLERWLGCPAGAVLEGRYAPMPLLS